MAVWAWIFFFIISGFIIVISTRPGTTASNFLKRRVLRVVPPYWLITFGAISLYALAGIVSDSNNFPTIGELTQSLLFIPYTPEDGRTMPILFVGWTLYYEMFFYLLFGLSIIWFSRMRAILCTALLLFAFYLFGQLARPDNVVSAFYTNPIILEFAWGMALAVLWLSREQLTPRLNGVLAVALIIGGIGFLAISDGHNPFISGVGAMLIVGGALVYEALGKTISNRWANFFGDISYSLYLIHTLAFYVFEALLVRLGLIQNPFIVFIALIIGFIAACFASWLSFKWVEQPLGRLARGRPKQLATS